MTHLVLDLGAQRHLSLEAGRGREALPFWDRPHDLGVRVHLYELENTRSIIVGHPVLGLDLVARLDASFEFGQPLLVAHDSSPCDPIRPLMTRSANRSPISSGDSS